jgi:hypothetical protein
MIFSIAIYISAIFVAINPWQSCAKPGINAANQVFWRSLIFSPGFIRQGKAGSEMMPGMMRKAFFLNRISVEPRPKGSDCGDSEGIFKY